MWGSSASVGSGILAIRFARAFGCEVTAFSSTAAKEAEARAHGAHHFVSSVDDAALKAQRESLDLIISTVNIPLSWKRYVSALRPHGVLSFVGALAEPVSIHTGMLMARSRSVTSSPIGGRPPCARCSTSPRATTSAAQVETLPMSDVNTALDRLRRNDVRYRFVLERGCAEGRLPVVARVDTREPSSRESLFEVELHLTADLDALRLR